MDIQENVENNTTIVWFDTADAGTNATDTSAAPEAEEAPHQQEEIVAKTIVSDDEDKNWSPAAAIEEPGSAQAIIFRTIYKFECVGDVEINLHEVMRHRAPLFTVRVHVHI